MTKVNTKWNIDKHKELWELDEHWKLRQSFMKKHKCLYPEERLVTLTKVFNNMEFLGSIYNKTLMSEVNDLANQVEEIVKFRAKKSSQIKKIFVNASEAAKLKIISVENNSNIETELNSDVNNKRTHLEETITSNVKEDYCPPCKMQKIVQTNEQPFNIKEKQTQSPIESMINQKQCDNTNVNSKNNGKTSYTNKRNVVNNINSLDFCFEDDRKLFNKVRAQEGLEGNFVIIGSTDEIKKNKQLQMLQTSFALAKVKVDHKHELIDSRYLHSIVINDKVYASIETTQSYTNKIKAVLKEKVFEHFQKHCFTLLRKSECFDAVMVTKDEFLNKSNSKEETSETTPVYSGYGAKIMKMMGWAGKGLGKNETGIETPVEGKLKMTLGREEIDRKSNFNKTALEFLKNFNANPDSNRFIKFTTEFSKGERAQLHELSRQLQLKSRSYGKGKSRYLIIEKPISIWDEIIEVLNAGGETDSILLIKPSHPDLYK